MKIMAVRRLTGAGLAALLFSAPAFGHGCDVTDDDRREASRVLSGVSARIDVMEGNIIQELRLQTGQLSGYVAQSAKAVTGALDSQTRLSAQIAREVEESRAVRERRPTGNGCEVVTGLTGLAATREAMNRAFVEGARREAGRLTGDGAVAAPGGAAADTAARFEKVKGGYCNAGRGGPGAEGCEGESGLHEADIRAEILFGKRTFANDEEVDAAVEVGRNLAAPLVHGKPFQSHADTDHERSLALLSRSADARAALAGEYFAHARALRMPGAGTLGKWAAAVGGDGTRDPAVPVSSYELLEILASSRFEKPEWFGQLQGMSAGNLLRELVTLQAISLMLDWEGFRINERRAAMEATRLALEVEDMRRRPGLAELVGGAN